MSCVPEDVPGLAAGVRMDQLLLQMLQRAVVDVDRTLQMAAVRGAVLGNLSAKTEVCSLGLRELNFFLSNFYKNVFTSRHCMQIP